MVNQTDVINRLRLEIETLLREYPDLADDEMLRADMLEGATNFREVLIGLVRSLGDTKALIMGLQAYETELERREERYEARQSFIRELIFRVMDSAQLKKIELPEATLSFRDNQPKVVGDADPETLPDHLCRITRVVDKKAVRAAIEAGQHVPGFVLSNVPPSLSVRVK